MRNKVISSLAGAAFSFAASGLAFAADMAVKAPPPAPAPVLTWTGFYGGIQLGGGWSDRAVNYSPNDPLALFLFVGPFSPGGQPIANNYRIPQSGAVGGVEAGYNWQVGSNWLLGLEADFSASGMKGRASGTSFLINDPIFGVATQTTTAEQSTDWYGTVRGRFGWIAVPNLLLFGTGGFAYGRVVGSANYLENGAITFGDIGPFSVHCSSGVVCYAGSSSAIRTGWTAGGGAEWLFDQHWSAKIEYQFVDLGTENVKVTALALSTPGRIPASFNAAFRDQFNVVRVGLNYKFGWGAPLVAKY
jgi:outer membrane immunogenic protein